MGHKEEKPVAGLFFHFCFVATEDVRLSMHLSYISVGNSVYKHVFFYIINFHSNIISFFIHLERNRHIDALKRPQITWLCFLSQSRSCPTSDNCFPFVVCDCQDGHNQQVLSLTECCNDQSESSETDQ